MSSALFAAVIVIASASPAMCAERAGLPPGAAVLDRDIVWDVGNPGSFAVSPDGMRIAYISKGAIWSCRVDAGPPSKLAELPNTITAILAQPGNEARLAISARSPQGGGYHFFTGPVHLDKDYVFSLAWTPRQDGVIYTVRKRIREHSAVAAYHVRCASLAGDVEEIAVIEGEFGVPDEYELTFAVTPDRKYVVVSGHAPLIWDIGSDRPRVTPFDRLIPSSSGRHFLGVEIDTRQLVVTDGEFRIVRRVDAFLPARRMCDLIWSPDERYAICLSRFEYPSHKIEGFRIDLQAETKTPLRTGIYRDRFSFTGNGGEVVRLGNTGTEPYGFGDGNYGAYISTLASDSDREDEICRFAGPPRKPREGHGIQSYPPILGNRDGSMFAIALPRSQDEPAGIHYHFVDREGKAVPFLPKTNDNYITPYYPIAFADGDRRLICRWGSTLFSMPAPVVGKDGEVREHE